MKNVFIITTFKIYEGNSAGSARLMNIARAVAGSENKVFLCSAVLSESINLETISEVSNNIFLVGKERKNVNPLFQKNKKRFLNIFVIYGFLKNIYKLIKQSESESAIYYYPDTEFSMDVLVLLYLKFIRRQRIFVDINELRSTMLSNLRYSRNIIKKVYQSISYSTYYFKYKVGEIMMKYFDGLVVISTNLEKYFSAYNKNLLRIPILSNCSDVIGYAPKAFTDGRFQIGFTGQLATKKEGFENFYKSLSVVKSRFADFQLNLYGPIYEPFEKELLLTILPQKYNLDGNIVYHGNVEQKYIMDVLRNQHLLVLPRPWNPQTHYGFSTKLSEYLISGIPVLMTDVSDNSLYIKDRESGFIIKPGDPDGLAVQILYIINNYNAIATKISENAFETARKYFHYENYRPALMKFLFSGV